MPNGPYPRKSAMARLTVLALAAGVCSLSAAPVRADPCVDAIGRDAAASAPADEAPEIFEAFGSVVRAGLDGSGGRTGLAPVPEPATPGDARTGEHPWQARALVGMGQRGRPTLGSSATAMEAALMVTRTLDDAGESTHRGQSQRHLAEALRHETAASRERRAEQLTTLLLERDRHRRKVLIASRWSRQLRCAAYASSTMADNDASTALQASQQHAQTLEEQARRALRQTSGQLRSILGDGLPLTSSIPASRLSTALRDLPAMTPQISSQWAANQARTAASDAQLQAQRAAWSPRWEMFAGARAMGSSAGAQPGVRADVGWLLGLSLQFDLDRQRMDQAIDQAQQELDARKQLSSSDGQWRQRAIDEQRSSAEQAMSRARRIASMLRDSETLSAPTADEWRAADPASAVKLLKSMRSHFELQAAYVDAWHDTQAAAVQALALGGRLIDWLD